MIKFNAEQQYLDILRDIIANGAIVENNRTKTRCFTVLNKYISFDGSEFPILTTRKINWKSAINEMLCYIRGYTKLEQFHSLGVHSWDANAKAWINPINPYGKAVGTIYGASAKKVGVDYESILKQLKDNPTDRGIIWNFWNPEYFKDGCLRPCMYSHQFNVVNGKLHLTSTMRSVDVPLGLTWNMIQCWFLLNITAHLTGLKVGTVTMNLVNCHIYEDQFMLAREHINREPIECDPVLQGIDKLTFLDVFTRNVTDKLSLDNYVSHPSIKYPFTV